LKPRTASKKFIFWSPKPTLEMNIKIGIIPDVVAKNYGSE
jgi:hypothetical protein